MINAILGTKQNMSAVFDKLGRRIPVTYIVAEPNVILEAKDNRVKLGFGKKKKAKKTENAQVKVAGFAPRVIKEFKTNDELPSALSKITVTVFKPGDEVKVTGVTRGRGFAGVVKRWGFAGGPKTHGQSDRHRAPGSIGQGTTPGRVFKGKKMPGHMGNVNLTIRGLEVIEVDENKNLLTVKGSVPGARRGLLIVEKTGEVKKPTMTQEIAQTAQRNKGDEGNKGNQGEKVEAKQQEQQESKDGEQNAES